MSTLNINIRMDNHAFAEDWRDEAARILRVAARALLAGEDGEIVLRDINGNPVGMMTTDLDVDKQLM